MSHPRTIRSTAIIAPIATSNGPAVTAPVINNLVQVTAPVVFGTRGERGMDGADGAILQQEIINAITTDIAALSAGVGELDHDFRSEIVGGLAF